MIKSFRNEETRQLFLTGRSTKYGAIARAALRKLNFMESANRLEDLKDPPGNRLEKLSADRAGQHSIRINDQYRLCFRWHEQAAWDVEVADYH